MEILKEQVKDRRERFQRFSVEFVAEEEYLNEGWRWSSELEGDYQQQPRDSSEVKYLQKALDLLERFHRRDTHRESVKFFFVERSSSS